MRDDKALFDRKNAALLGVNDASPDSHRSYCEKFAFNFPILADRNLEMSKAYRAEKDGRVKRTVVVIAPDGKIAFHQHGMPTDDQILGVLR